MLWLDGPEPGDTDRAAALAAIQQLPGHWREADGPIDCGGTLWRPDMIGDEERILHLSLAGEVAGVFLNRIRAAAALSKRVTVAFAAVLDDIEQMSILQELDIRIISLERVGDQYRPVEHRSIADWLCDGRIYLGPEDFRRLAGERFDQAVTGAKGKGRWFEETLCLIFNQVSWLDVDEHAYRNATEEIDIVMSARAGGYAAQLARAPIVIATAKNEASATGSSVVKYLKEQVANRKGRCELGFLCSATTVSPDAEREILRGSQSSTLVIVPLHGEAIQGMIDSPEEIDYRIEQLIKNAITD